MNVEVIRRIKDDKFFVVKLLEPIYKHSAKIVVAYNIGTEITVADDELIE